MLESFFSETLASTSWLPDPGYQAAIFVSISEHHAVVPHDLQRIVWDAFEQYQPYVNGAGVCETEHAEGEFREPVRWHTRRSKVYRQASMVAEGND